MIILTSFEVKVRFCGNMLSKLLIFVIAVACLLCHCAGFTSYKFTKADGRKFGIKDLPRPESGLKSDASIAACHAVLDKNFQDSSIVLRCESSFPRHIRCDLSRDIEELVWDSERTEPLKNPLSSHCEAYVYVNYDQLLFDIRDLY